MEMNPLEKLTIIIFSKNRNHFLRETLIYYQNYQIRTLVLHDCIEPLVDVEEFTFASYFPSDKSLSERFKVASKLIKTRYSIFSGDDELFLPSALKEMIWLMEMDSALASCGGQALGITQYKNRIIGNLAYGNLIDYHNDSPTLANRVEYQTNYKGSGLPVGAFYRVMKTEIMGKVLDTIGKLENISCVYVSEIIPDIYLTFFGKCIYTNEIFWIRNWINPSVNSRDFNRSFYFHEWWNALEYLPEKENFIQLMFRSIPTNLDILEFTSLLNEFAIGRKITELNENSRIVRSNTRYLLRRVKTKLRLEFYLLRHHGKDEGALIRKRLSDSNVLVNSHELETSLTTVENYYSIPLK